MALALINNTLYALVPVETQAGWLELADICKIDLNKLEAEIREINSTCKIFRISAVNQDTLTGWNKWLDEQVGEYKKN